MPLSPSCLRHALLLCLHAGAASAAGFPARLDLASLRPENGGDGRHGLVLHSALPGASGFDVDAALLPDFNGDGMADLALGAPALYNPQIVRGAAWIVFGGPQLPTRIDLDALDGRNGIALALGSAPAPQQNLGQRLAAIGDINGDGREDVAVASNKSAFVLFGRKADAPLPARLDLGALDDADGVRIDVGLPPHGDAGIDALGAAGDLDGDGIDDFHAGDSLWRSGDGASPSGALYAIYGRHTFPATLSVTALGAGQGYRVTQGHGRFEFGAGGLAAQADFDRDGRNDLVASDDRYGIVRFGAPPPLVTQWQPAPPDGSDGFRIAAGSEPAFSVAGSGDFNADGWPDVALAEEVRSYPGPLVPGRSVIVVFGHAPPYPAIVAAADLDGSNGFRYLAERDAALAGARVASVGDINGDGIDDLAIGSVSAFLPAMAERSVVHVLFGRRNGFPAQLDESMLDGRNGFLIAVSDSNGEYGRIAGRGDFNADGIGDLVIAIYHNEGAFPGRPGDFAYVVYGRETSLFNDGFGG